MAGSESEAILRAKAVTLLRQAVPGGRIIHELELGGRRLDLAIVGEDALIIGEVKSDRDCLDRLQGQMKAALAVSANVWLFCGRKHADEVKRRRAADYGYRYDLFIETDDGLEREHGWGMPPLRTPRDSWRLLSILMKPELQALAAPFGGKSRMNCTLLAELVHDGMTGREVRQAALAALRARRFYWADAPVIDARRASGGAV